MAWALTALVVAVIASLAAWRGAWPERLVAAAMVAGLIAAPLIELHPIGRHPHLGLFVVDSALLMVVVGVALGSDRWWPLFCSAFVLAATAMGLASAFNDGLSGLTGAAGPLFWNGMAALSLAASLWELRRRRSPPPEAIG
jgi:hypothetical protein